MPCPNCPPATRDHLRVCGADILTCAERKPVVGSSPRVRSRPSSSISSEASLGIISACAEQTAADGCGDLLCGDHLRVCGADPPIWVWSCPARGSSPRVRSRRLRRQHERSAIGIISACAEQTPSINNAPLTSWDHLRVCGADLNVPGSPVKLSGSSPRVRSRPASSCSPRR